MRRILPNEEDEGEAGPMASVGGSSSSSQHGTLCDIRAVQARHKTDSIAPRCFCGLRLSNHCKYFMWLDEHVGKIGGETTTYIGGNEVVTRVSHSTRKGGIEKRVAKLEKKLASVENNKNVRVWAIVVALITSCTI
ncbi:hypothetical protein PIB30_048548 [Stylosanthes scabra]|uniref:Zinc finger GRF-type domain-containing protein n=1 Tax=Stylosanthes scabra TaxID=79078 RepID=A0ABU6RH49_9FABA|nr:hypothetical protein [Stylosanthes scabra]